MKTNFKRIISPVQWLLLKLAQAAKWLWKRYPEVYMIPAAFVLWALSSTVIWFFDPTAGAFDAGVFQIPVFSIVLLFIFLSVSWLAMKVLFGTASKFLRSGLKNAFNNITPWQKIIYATSIFFLLLYALVRLSHTLLLTRPGAM